MSEFPKSQIVSRIWLAGKTKGYYIVGLDTTLQFDTAECLRCPFRSDTFSSIQEDYGKQIIQIAFYVMCSGFGVSDNQDGASSQEARLQIRYPKVIGRLTHDELRRDIIKIAPCGIDISQ